VSHFVFMNILQWVCVKVHFCFTSNSAIWFTINLRLHARQLKILKIEIVQFDLWRWHMFFMPTLFIAELVCKCCSLFMKLINENVNSHRRGKVSKQTFALIYRLHTHYDLRVLYFSTMGCSCFTIKNKSMWNSLYDENIKRSNKTLYKRHLIFDFQ
jgi:hypothetical protein